MLVGAIFFVIGVGMLVGGILWGLRTQKFVASAERASGTVIDLERSQSGDDGPTYRPVVRFATADGKEVTFTSSTGSNPPSHREGDAVKVLYDRERPDDAEIDSFMSLWFGPLLVGGLFGTIFPLVGVLAMLGGLRERAARKRLRENGQRIVAEVQGVEGVTGGAGWTITAKATDPRGIQRIFRSAPLTRDPGPALVGRGTVDVIVDPNDYGTYEVDLAFLNDVTAGSIMR